jgi:cytochrome c5
MDRQDKEFEAFLQQFRLRKHRPFPEEPGVEVGTGWTRRRWILVAAAAAVVATVSLPVIRQFSHKTSLSAIVQGPGDSAYRAGEVIEAGTPIRSGGSERLLVRLEDGTHVEMRSQSEFVLESSDDGARIRLKHGSILVSAAEQKDGHLQVEAHDIVATVVGTVFLVETQSAGSRVGVLEGEVEVRHKLGEGQQVSTDASLEGQSLAQAIAWSSRALPPSAPPPVQTAVVTPPPEPAIAPVRRVQIPTPPAAAPLPQPPLPPLPQQGQSTVPKPQDDAGADGPGKALVEGMCASCHAADLITGRTATREEWQGIIDRMKGYGTAMDDKQTAILLDYLVRRYGPKQTPPPATPPAAPAPGPAGADGPGKQTFYRACVACHSDEIVRSRQWASREAVAARVEIDVRAGAQVTPSEVPALVEFIYQTWGIRTR